MYFQILIHPLYQLKLLLKVIIGLLLNISMNNHKIFCDKKF